MKYFVCITDSFKNILQVAGPFVTEQCADNAAYFITLGLSPEYFASSISEEDYIDHINKKRTIN